MVWLSFPLFLIKLGVDVYNNSYPEKDIFTEQYEIEYLPSSYRFVRSVGTGFPVIDVSFDEYKETHSNSTQYIVFSEGPRPRFNYYDFGKSPAMRTSQSFGEVFHRWGGVAISQFSASTMQIENDRLTLEWVYPGDRFTIVILYTFLALLLFAIYGYTFNYIYDQIHFRFNMRRS